MDEATVGMDGNCGFALLGEDLVVGEAEFVEISQADIQSLGNEAAEERAWMAALDKLRTRLDKPEMTFRKVTF